MAKVAPITKWGSKFFFLDDRLYKIVRVVRPADVVECWSFEDGRELAFPWSMVKRKRKRAYMTGKVAEMLNRHKVNVLNHVLAGHIAPPIKVNAGFGGKYMWSDRNILDLHDYLLTVHCGGRRKDGKITPHRNLPSRAELLAKLNDHTVTYIKDSNGEFIPTWNQTTDW